MDKSGSLFMIMILENYINFIVFLNGSFSFIKSSKCSREKVRIFDAYLITPRFLLLILPDRHIINLSHTTHIMKKHLLLTSLCCQTSQIYRQGIVHCGHVKKPKLLNAD